MWCTNNGSFFLKKVHQQMAFKKYFGQTQVPFIEGLEAPEGFGGWLEIRDSSKKNWKKRYAFLSRGSLRYYGKGPSGSADDPADQTGSFRSEGVDIKGEIMLTCADVAIVEDTQINLTIRGDRKSSYFLKLPLGKQAADWYTAFSKEIQNQHIQLLNSGSRSPEVIEWYYQYQSDLYRRNQFMTRNTEVTLHLQSCIGANLEAHSEGSCLFNVSMSEDRQGLLFTSPSTGKKTFNRLVSINNGRVIPWTDITGATLPIRGWELDDRTGHFPFTLITTEDELYMEMDAVGVPWLRAVKEMVVFTRIPKPAARSIAMNTSGDRSLTRNNTLMEFSAHSGAVFACSSDVLLLLENLTTLASRYPVLPDITTRISIILKLIPDLKCNKEAALNFGDRLEEMTRVLADVDSGIIHNAKDNDKTLLNFHLSTFNNKLNEVIKYFQCQSTKGWLIFNLSNRTADSAKMKYNTLDLDLVNIVNTLIKAMNLSPSLKILPKKDYVMAVDVRKSIEALGGIHMIFDDVPKERSLARLIQAEGHEIHGELSDFINNAAGANKIRSSSVSGGNNGGGWRQFDTRNPRLSSSDSYSAYSELNDRNNPNNNQDNSSQGGCRRFFTCCFSKRKQTSGGSKVSMRSTATHSRAGQLDEPLVR